MGMDIQAPGRPCANESTTTLCRSRHVLCRGVDDILQEGEDVAVGGDHYGDGHPGSGEALRKREHDGTHQQHQHAAAAKRINKRAGEPREEPLGPRRALKLNLHRHALGATMAAELLLCADRDTGLAEEELALAAEEPARQLGVVLARAGANCAGRSRYNWRGSDGGRLATGAKGNGGRGRDTGDPGWSYGSRRGGRGGAPDPGGGGGGGGGAPTGGRIRIEHHFHPAQMYGLARLERRLFYG